MARIPIALQLFSVRKECAKDLENTLRAVAQMGYEGVEFAGYHDHSASDLEKMLDDCGLQVVGSHLGIQLLDDEVLERTAAFEEELGNRYLVVPGLPASMTASREDWLRTADRFSALADALAVRGMRVGYHNHIVEFTPMDGELPWDIFFGNTSPDVIMQVDTGNAMHGGGDPVPCVERYPGRATTVHLKEFSKSDPDALIGDGDMEWQRFFDLCETVGGTEWYIVEQESEAHNPLDCVARCLENLRAIGK